jgi:Bacteriophage head to tail connecting protein
MYTKEIDKHLKRLSALKTERASYDTHWRELADYVMPRSVVFNSSDRNKGGKINQNIIDNTATLALRTLASGMMAGLTSPARPWFRLTTSDPAMMEDAATKEWLFDVEAKMREVFSRSNLYNILPSCYQDLGLFGTAAFEVAEDHEDVIRCYPYAIGEYYLANNHRLSVDTLYREVALTVDQIVGRFGLASVSESVKSQYDRGNYDQIFDVVHVVEPNRDAKPGSMLAKHKPYKSCYFEKSRKDGQYLRESGYDEFPVLSPRWSLPGNSVYGESPGMFALPDIKALQLEQRRKLQGIDKMVNPPMIGDTQLRNQRASLLSGDITYISGMTNGAVGLKPIYEVNPRLGELLGDMQEIQARIRTTFFADMMTMLASGDNSQMTAREVEERHQEKLLVLGPVMERLNDELLDPLIDRTFAIMAKRNLVPLPPKHLEGENLRVEYISIMGQAQKMIGTGSIERLAGFAGNLAAVRPDVLDKIDFDQTIDEYANMLGVPPRMIMSDDKVAEMRAAKAKAAQAQQAQQLIPMAGEAASAAKVLSETDVSEPNALTRLLGAA